MDIPKNWKQWKDEEKLNWLDKIIEKQRNVYKYLKGDEQ